jgi:hypothetical protein
MQLLNGCLLGFGSKEQRLKLPSAEKAVVDEAKVRDYLLSESHPVGRYKAAFFRSLGYRRMRWQDLAVDLRCHAKEHEASVTEANTYGQKYEVRGNLKGPAS